MKRSQTCSIGLIKGSHPSQQS
ncbi:hypothetical protein Godav_015165 [Gossypium davidsonii]|uniref:Uncharacterized protein n=2 Tax=Gossypium TaxID=3633 RepID=A0A7J8RMM0_GOSDV|nr:hypothetical protein [Gossypium davidsonii]MBA0650177.1 hypothetical protein [Gossypium klotzschianum]